MNAGASDPRASARRRSPARLAVVAGALALALGGCGGEPALAARRRPAAEAADAAGCADAAAGAARRARAAPHAAAHEPGGHVVTTVGRYTSFRSRQVLAVVARRGDWLGVLSEHVSNSRTAWIPAASAELVHEPYRLDVDLSARRLVVRRDGRVVRRVRIAIGRPEVPTPTGRFAVTDALRIGAGSGAYGCCALALTARQPNVAQGWTGGDRIAIHGTSDEASIGTPASGGCLRARDADMRWMLGRVTLGAEVRIRA